MFRGTKKTDLSPKNFGAGSLITEGRCKYLVVAAGTGVQLLSMESFELIGKPAPVEDPNFISREELHTLIAPLQVATSDCDYDPKGLKS